MEQAKQIKSTIDLSDKAIDRYMKAPEKYWGASLKDLKGVSKMIDTAWEALKQNRSVTFYGDCGIGKTHSAICLAREWAKKNIKVITTVDGEFIRLDNVPYFTQPLDLLDSIKASWGEGGATESELMEFYCNKGLLVLDDLGVGNWSEWAKGMMYKIINYRDINSLPVIVTTNLSLGKLADVIDPRISSRLHGMGEVITLGDKDWRVK